MVIILKMLVNFSMHKCTNYIQNMPIKYNQYSVVTNNIKRLEKENIPFVSDCIPESVQQTIVLSERGNSMGAPSPKTLLDSI